MRAGRLSKRITIQQTSESQSSTGAVTDSWTTFQTVSASIRPLTGKEFFASQQFTSELHHIFSIRYLSGVTTKMQIIYDSRTFDIMQVVNMFERNQELVLICKERTQ